MITDCKHLKASFLYDILCWKYLTVHFQLLLRWKDMDFWIHCFLIFFPAINRGDVKDSDIDLIMDSIVDSLFSVFVNLGKEFY